MKKYALTASSESKVASRRRADGPHRLSILEIQEKNDGCHSSSILKNERVPDMRQRWRPTLPGLDHTRRFTRVLLKLQHLNEPACAFADFESHSPRRIAIIVQRAYGKHRGTRWTQLLRVRKRTYNQRVQQQRRPYIHTCSTGTPRLQRSHDAASL